MGFNDDWDDNDEPLSMGTDDERAAWVAARSDRMRKLEETAHTAAQILDEPHMAFIAGVQLGLRIQQDFPDEGQEMHDEFFLGAEGMNEGLGEIAETIAQENGERKEPFMTSTDSIFDTDGEDEDDNPFTFDFGR